MCGILALLNWKGMINDSTVERMLEAGKDRGPENTSNFTNADNIYMGFHRLAINGLNSLSNQPLNIDNIVLICNGEIYNYMNLYKLLNISPHTGSDCEIIIHLYKRYGIEETLKLIDGVFAFVLYDFSSIEREPIVYVARDPFGVRPLYMIRDCNIDLGITESVLKNYDRSTSGLQRIYGFASELKSLIPINTIHLNNNLEYLQFLPGTYSKFTKSYMVNSLWKKEIENRKYFTLPINNLLNENKTVYYENIAKYLDEAVKKRVVGTSDREIGCLLSGGLDSSLITALVVKHSLRKVKTFSIGMKGSKDLEYARLVANYLKTDHKEIILEVKDFLEAIPEVIEKIESYDTTTVRASVGNYLVGKYIKEFTDVKVVFNGDGSDELTGGYLYFHCSPSIIESDKETRRLLSDIYMFDVLRSDKSISSNGLEPRTPFLDKSFVCNYLSIPMEERFREGVCEKHLLRTAIDINFPTLLPKDILWRTKEAFSDGVSGDSGDWYKIIQKQLEKRKKSGIKYSHLPPETNEQEYYREIFENKYKDCGKILPYFWMPKYVNAEDSSARSMQIYKEIMKND